MGAGHFHFVIELLLSFVMFVCFDAPNGDAPGARLAQGRALERAILGCLFFIVFINSKKTKKPYSKLTHFTFKTNFGSRLICFWDFFEAQKIDEKNMKM